MRFCVPSSVTLLGETASVILVAGTLVIVPVTAVVVPIVYPVPEARVKATVSSLSTVVSGVGSTVTVAVAELAAKMTPAGIEA